MPGFLIHDPVYPLDDHLLLDRIDAALSEWRLLLQPGSRFDLYRTVARRFRQSLILESHNRLHNAVLRMPPRSVNPPPEYHAWYVAMQSLAELNQLCVILESLNKQKNRLVRSKVRTMLAGEPGPEDERAGQTLPRDIQFELLCFATLIRSGLIACMDEPDMVLAIEDAKYGLACKRAQSPKSVRNSLLKGWRQVRESKLPSIILVDCSMWMRTFLGVPRYAAESKRPMDGLDHEIDRIHDHVCWIAQKRSVQRQGGSVISVGVMVQTLIQPPPGFAGIPLSAWRINNRFAAEHAQRLEMLMRSWNNTPWPLS